jgi:hypothetical protein
MRKPWKIERRKPGEDWRRIPEAEYRTQDRANTVARGYREAAGPCVGFRVVFCEKESN